MKEQKGRLTELMRSKQEQSRDNKVSILYNILGSILGKHPVGQTCWGNPEERPEDAWQVKGYGDPSKNRSFLILLLASQGGTLYVSLS